MYLLNSTRFKQKIRMEVDISNYVMEKVLPIEYEDEKQRLVITIKNSKY